VNLPIARLMPKPEGVRCHCQALTVATDFGATRTTVDGTTHGRYSCQLDDTVTVAEPPAKALFFIARDADGIPCLWRDDPDHVTCLFRKGEHGADDDVWLLLASHPDTQTAGHGCGYCGVFVLDADPADVDHLAVVEQHRNGACGSAA